MSPFFSRFEPIQTNDGAEMQMIEVEASEALLLLHLQRNVLRFQPVIGSNHVRTSDEQQAAEALASLGLTK